jgi:hypothetical protein
MSKSSTGYRHRVTVSTTTPSSRPSPRQLTALPVSWLLLPVGLSALTNSSEYGFSNPIDLSCFQYLWRRGHLSSDSQFLCCLAVSFGFLRHRPVFNPRTSQPVVLTTQERSHNEERWGNLMPTLPTHWQVIPSAESINFATEEIRAVLTVPPSGTRIHQNEIAEAIGSEEIFHFDRTESLVLDFRDEVSRHPLADHCGIRLHGK